MIEFSWWFVDLNISNWESYLFVNLIVRNSDFMRVNVRCLMTLIFFHMLLSKISDYFHREDDFSFFESIDSFFSCVFVEFYLVESYCLAKEWIANCCLSNLDEKSSSLYRNSFSTISFTNLSSHDSSRSLWESRSSIVTEFFLLIKLSSSFVVTSIWSHQNRILIFVLIDLSTISKINKC